MLNMRWLVTLLIVFNIVAIGFAEVQRRELVRQSDEFQQASAAKLERSLTDNDQRVQRTLAYVKSAVDDSTRILSTRVDALLLVYGIKLNPADSDPARREALRVYQVTLLKSALDNYRRQNKTFPIVRTGSVAALEPALVGGGYLDSIPDEPSGRPYQYTTEGASNGKRYGLKVPLESGGECLTSIGAENSGWWGAIPMCPF